MESQIEEPKLSTATPQEWARSFAEATKSMDVPKIVSLASSQTTVFYNNGQPQKTAGRVQHGEGLNEFYGAFEATGKGIAAVDYSITQSSDDFALVRFTWEVTKVEPAEVIFRVNSSYLLRREHSGWRFVAVLEQGKPNGP